MKLLKAHETWKRGWLMNKPFVFNKNHQWFNPVIDNIARDIKNGQNRIIILVGTPRSGKSWGSLWLQCYLNWCLYGRKEYKPDPNNVEPLKDMYWEINDFLKATKNPNNWKKFITLEEWGVADYKLDFQSEETKGQDKLLQIFGVDETNLIINLPYIFDLKKGTRLKGHYLLKFIRRSKTKVNVIFCKRWMSDTTEKAKFIRKFTWEGFPNIYDIYPTLVDEYEKIKRKYNSEKKDELIHGKKVQKKKESEKVSIFGKI